MFDLSRFDPLKYDLSKIDQGWALILVAFFGGIATLIRALWRSRQSGLAKILETLLLGLFSIAFLSGVFYVAVVVPQTPKATPAPLVFQARLNRLVVYVYRDPSIEYQLLPLDSSSMPVQIIAQVHGGTWPGSRSDIWYQVRVRSGQTEETGYIFGELLELTPPPDQPNATPPVVTLTPTAHR